MVERVTDIVALTRGPVVLDIGCSGGHEDDKAETASPDWLHGALLASFEKVVGIDNSETKVRFLLDHGFSDVVTGNAEDFSLEDRFDTIVAGEVIEHLVDPARFLRNAASHLAPGGQIVLSTPYHAGLYNVLYAWLKFPKTTGNPEHTMWFCPTTMKRLVEEIGLVLEEIKLTTDYPLIPGRPLYAGWRFLYRTFGRLVPMRIRANCFIAVLRCPTNPALRDEAGGVI
ncbi:MAG: class I SAM-dependent methyltransferase [Acidimicrobiales bacterium]